MPKDISIKLQDLAQSIQALAEAVSVLEKAMSTKSPTEIKKAKELVLALQKQIQKELES
jgi:hypothetical protein